MPATIIDGKKIADQIKNKLTNTIKQQIEQGNNRPGLAVILVGQDSASQIYVNHKRKACEQVGIQSFNYDLPSDVSQDKLIALIEQLNNDKNIHGILIQLPLPKHISQIKIIETIAPEKDVDGFHPYNVGRLATRNPAISPCTPLGIMHLINETKINLKQTDAVIVGASNIVGRPLALLLLLAGATVTICHKFTKDLKNHVAAADLLVVAVGKPNLIPGDWVKPGSCIIDVGINRDDNGIISGDVEFASAKERAKFITPVPGGVGPMTVAYLLANTVTACYGEMGS